MISEDQVFDDKFVERFWSKVDKTTICWKWLGSCNLAGYGQITLTNNNGKFVLYAHRLSYMLHANEYVPEGMQIDHLCRNRACVNPDHFEVVTATENKRRGESPAAKAARQTHCIYGHILDEQNTYINKFGHRYCRKCNAQRQRERNKRR